MSYILNFDNGAAVIPISALKKISEGVSPEDLAALCLMLEHGISSRPWESVLSEISEKGLMSEEKLKLSAAFWHGAGVLRFSGSEYISAAEKITKPAPSKNEKLQTGAEAETVSSDKLIGWMDGSDHTQAFIKTCEDIYGDIFNQTELTIILTFSQEYRMKDECIFMILGYCRDHNNSISYAKRIFARMVDNGIDTIEGVRAELDFLASHSAYVTNVKQIFGLERALTTNEKPIVEKWQKEYSFTLELIQLAFDKAALIGKARIAYCNKILIGWREEGLKTADEVRTMLERNKDKAASANASQGKNSSFVTEDFFAAAVSRSYRDKDKKTQTE